MQKGGNIVLDNEDSQILDIISNLNPQNGTLSINFLNREIVQKAFDSFKTIVSKKATNIDCPIDLPDGLDIVTYYEKASTRVMSDITRDKIQKSAYFYLNRLTENRDYVGIINLFMTKSIDELNSYFDDTTLETLAIFYGYLGYLIDVKNRKITCDTLLHLKRQHLWIEDLKNNRGFTTINDKARKITTSIFDMLYDVGLDENAIANSFDFYFTNPNPDNLLSRYAKEYTENPEKVFMFKKYMIRIMFSDIYLNLKASEDGEDTDFDEELLKYIENSIKKGEYLLPSNQLLRKRLYLKSYSCLRTDYDRHFLVSILIVKDEIKTLKLSNPLYFLD